MYFLKHTKISFVINNFSDIVFFKKRFIPHMEVFLELSTYDALEFLKAGDEWVFDANIFWSCTFRFSKQEHQS